MEKDRTKKITMIVLIVAVIGLTVAFAALSQNLTINGSANVDAATWNIHFDNLGEAQISGEAIENEKPIINEDDKVRIDGINVTLNNPKDKVVYNVDLVNEGSIDAEISNIVVPTLTEEQEKYLEFKVAYSDTDKELAIGDALNKGETKPLTITIRYKDEIDPSDLPKGKDIISLSYELTFVQTDGKEVTPTQPSEDEKEMFTWDGPTVVTGLTDYGIEQVKSNGGHLVIPEGVTEIAGTTIQEVSSTGYVATGFSPFAISKLNVNDNDQTAIVENLEYNIIKSVSFPSTLKKIGGCAFYGCANLIGELNLPDNLEEIGEYAFGVTGITGELIIPDSVTTIGDGAFNMSGISGELIIPDSVITIGASAFENCENLTGELIIPDTVVTIGDRAFKDTSIKSLTLGNSVETIRRYAFSNTQISGELYIPDSVLTVERSAFVGTNITSVSIPSYTEYNDKRSDEWSFPYGTIINKR